MTPLCPILPFDLASIENLALGTSVIAFVSNIIIFPSKYPLIEVPISTSIPTFIILNWFNFPIKDSTPIVKIFYWFNFPIKDSTPIVKITGVVTGVIGLVTAFNHFNKYLQYPQSLKDKKYECYGERVLDTIKETSKWLVIGCGFPIGYLVGTSIIKNNKYTVPAFFIGSGLSYGCNKYYKFWDDFYKGFNYPIPGEVPHNPNPNRVQIRQPPPIIFDNTYNRLATSMNIHQRNTEKRLDNIETQLYTLSRKEEPKKTSSSPTPSEDKLGGSDGNDSWDEM